MKITNKQAKDLLELIGHFILVEPKLSQKLLTKYGVKFSKKPTKIDLSNKMVEQLSKNIAPFNEELRRLLNRHIEANNDELRAIAHDEDSFWGAVAKIGGSLVGGLVGKIGKKKRRRSRGSRGSSGTQTAQAQMQQKMAQMEAQRRREDNARRQREAQERRQRDEQARQQRLEMERLRLAANNRPQMAGFNNPFMIGIIVLVAGGFIFTQMKNKPALMNPTTA